jgi:ParB family chromosome partitioning protein
MPHSKDKTNIALAGFEDIFNVGTAGSLQNGEHIQMLPLTELHEPDPHPFIVRDDEAMMKLAENVREYGIREPGLARRVDNGYELLCGNRRKRACELAGLTEMPVIVRELTDEQAVLAMVDSNLQQRETILPSEKAWAYRCRMEALNHNGVKAERNSCDTMAAQTGESAAQIFRFIRLTELVDKLLDMVDTKQLALTPAVELSHLEYTEQYAVADCMTKYEVKPSLSQAVRLKRLNQAGTLTAEMIEIILAETKKHPRGEPTGSALYRRFFPPSYSPKKIYELIVLILTNLKESTAV